MLKLFRSSLLRGAIMATWAITLEATTTTGFSNVTSTSLTGTTIPKASVCCFVIQETVNEIWAEIYTTSTWYNVVNKTAVTALVTPYPNTTVTNFQTNIHTTNATFTTPVPYGQNVLADFANNAPGPTEASTVYNESLTVVAGQTIYSPQAAYVYTTVKVITAAPATDTNGNPACGTPWSFPTADVLFWIGNKTTTSGWNFSGPTEIFPSINSNAQAYWGSDIAGLSSTTVDNYLNTVTRTYYPTPITYSDTTYLPTTATNTQTGVLTVDFWVNSKFQSVDTDAAKQTGVTITLDKPFVYQPKTAALGTTGPGSMPCRDGLGTEGYGYPPQTLIDYMVQRPAISSQYPGLEHCIPAGPSMLPYTFCSNAGGNWQANGGDLTETTTLTVTPELALTTAVSTLANAGGVSSIQSSVSPSTTIVPASPSLETPAENTSTSAAIPSTEVSPTESSSSSDTPLVTPPISDSPSPVSVSPATPIETPQGGDTSPPSSTQTSNSPGAGIASVIASIVGANPIQSATVIDGTTEVIVSGQTTIPYNPAAPVSGQTITSGGITQVVVSSATTVLLSQVLDDLPGSTALVSGTLEVVLGPSTVAVNSKLPGLSGSTTIISGTPYVVVTAQTTVPVALGIPTGLAGGTSNETTPIQVSGGERSCMHVRIEGMLILMGLAAMPFI